MIGVCIFFKLNIQCIIFLLLVLNDIISTMYNKRYMDEVFKPQELHSKKAMRTVFDRLAHASIMRLNAASMDKVNILCLLICCFYVYWYWAWINILTEEKIFKITKSMSHKCLQRIIILFKPMELYIKWYFEEWRCVVCSSCMIWWQWLLSITLASVPDLKISFLSPSIILMDYELWYQDKLKLFLLWTPSMIISWRYVQLG